jgi:hypothetical protein
VVMQDEDDTSALACELLGEPSFRLLAADILSRCMLEDGRFEAMEFGSNEHSTASAGAVLLGFSSVPVLDREALVSLRDAGLGLVRPDGRVRGHDANPEIGTTSWSISQLALGLSHCVGDDDEAWSVILQLIHQVCDIQDPTGGWPIRPRDQVSATLTFYPVLLLTRAWTVGRLRDQKLRKALSDAFHFLYLSLHSGQLPLVEQVLSLFCLQRISRLISIDPHEMEEVERLVAELKPRLVAPDGSLALVDQVITGFRQPQWHSTTWHPLLYMCVRRWGPPMAPVSALLAGRLINGFDARVRAWHGPFDASVRPKGVPWASAQAIRALYVFAQDLRAEGVTAAQFIDRLSALDRRRHEFDVVISFGGPDREVAADIARRIQAAGYRVFYDRDYQHRLLGEDLTVTLQETYFQRSRFAVAILSRAFVSSRWAGGWEWRAVLARMQQQDRGYVLPYFLEEVNVPGLNPTIGYVSAADFSPNAFADLVIRKLKEA